MGLPDMPDAAPLSRREAHCFVASAQRRLGVLALAGCLWLLLAAIPAFADGGPHIMVVNSGASGLAADCAGCHRAHTAVAAKLLKAAEPTLCLSCHNGMGATTDVVDGLQYRPTGTSSFQQTNVLGALRGGGFSYALIGSGSAVRHRYGGNPEDFSGKVPVLAVKQTTTSAHMPVGASAQALVWGSGAVGSGYGATLTLECTSCHNPHGNGNYRILKPIPADTTSGTDTFLAPSSGIVIADATAATQVRNYTVIQTTTPLFWASSITANLAYTATSGDYWRRTVPWTGSSGWDKPDGMTTFYSKISTWCSLCHTRYYSSGNTDRPTDDPIFTYQHRSNQPECTQCHVAHGSNALMDATFSATLPEPNGSPAPTYSNVGPGNSASSGDSRLLKVDNRGTCNMCHDPTDTILSGTYSPSGAPIPGTP